MRGRSDFVVLTHAHIDHSGLIPKLVKAGFDGPIYATQATADLLEFMLPDSASIQESNAERLNRQNVAGAICPRSSRSTAPKMPREHSNCCTRWSTRTGSSPSPGVHVRYWNAGHILGSASAELKLDATVSGNPLRMLFSGDLGPDEKVFHPEPDAPEGFDYIVCESTYGGRDREDYTLAERRATLRDELKRGLERGGNVVIPSFAVERSQELLHDIGVLLARREIPEATVFPRFPARAQGHRGLHSPRVKASRMSDVPPEDLFRDPHFRLVQSVDESKAINKIKARRGHHLGQRDVRRRSDPTPPPQQHLAAGIDGAVCRLPGAGHPRARVDERFSKDVRIHGKEFKVRAAIRRIGNYSAHADQGELADWITERSPVVGRLFLNHGEDDARRALARPARRAGPRPGEDRAARLRRALLTWSPGRPSPRAGSPRGSTTRRSSATGTRTSRCSFFASPTVSRRPKTRANGRASSPSWRKRWDRLKSPADGVRAYQRDGASMGVIS